MDTIDEKEDNTTETPQEQPLKKGHVIKKAKKRPIQEMTREELEERVRQLEAHNVQLKNCLAKCTKGENANQEHDSRKKAEKRKFDFSKHSKRHILLKFLYLGWDYQGYAVQEDTGATIEAHVMEALLKTKLIESRETSNYHRCGRTDKGVSAFGQVISITVRSNVDTGIGLVLPNGEKPDSVEENLDKEIKYVNILNKVLPADIRMLAWCPVKEGFSARFDCSQRTYKYFFPKGDLRIQAMNHAAQLLVGEHDYRNLCKMDVGNGVVNFKRSISRFEIEHVHQISGKVEGAISKNGQYGKCEVGGHDFNCTEMKGELPLKSLNDTSDIILEKRKGNAVAVERDLNVSDVEGSDKLINSSGITGNKMYIATIEGQAFLWHQVRAMMAMLVLVGEGKEEPGVVQELLDIQTHPRKPQYSLASEIPLNLYETKFEGVDWHWEEEALRDVISHLQQIWAGLAIRETMLQTMIEDLKNQYYNTFENEDQTRKFEFKNQSHILVAGPRAKVYRPLFDRPKCESLEERVDHYVKKNRLDPDIMLKMAN
ncbi:tRNA pseudouridine(38/39) synthase-like [Oratosquilla oratoria]|uniref:tRNA pseudouridine(38/39) synthase-like n=1 Tax=Oratosquilla oratoria TaxID=337810 RepID=UPI003F75B440